VGLQLRGLGGAEGLTIVSMGAVVLRVFAMMKERSARGGKRNEGGGSRAPLWSGVCAARGPRLERRARRERGGRRDAAGEVCFK
jgi:hypothetical protein